MISCSMRDILHVVTALLLVTSRGGCDVTVALPTAEYYRLTGELSIALYFIMQQLLLLRAR